MARKKKKVTSLPIGKPIDRVKYTKLKNCVNCLERDLGGTPKTLENLDITFEYIVGSLFPDVLSNMNDELTKKYIEGYNKGKEEFRYEAYPTLSSKLKIHIDSAYNYLEIVSNQLENGARAAENKDDKKVLREMINDIYCLMDKYKKTMEADE